MFASLKEHGLPVVALTLAIALSPSFVFGELEGGRPVEIRAEDILLVFLGLVWIASFFLSGKKTIEKPPLFVPIMTWLIVGVGSVFTNWMFGNIGFSRGFFYFLKEVEFFFLYFYLFYHIRNLHATKSILSLWIMMGLVHIGWILYELITGVRISYYYGPTAFIEPRNSFGSGGFFLILFIFLFNVLLYYYFSLNMSFAKKAFITTAIVSLAIGVFASASYSNFVGFVFAVLTTLFFFVLRRKKIRFLIIGLLMIALMSSIFLFLFSKIDALERVVDFERLKIARVWIWKAQLQDFFAHPQFLLIGLGKSVSLFAGDESHSQYVRNFIETGILGSVAFLLLMFSIIKQSAHSFFSRNDSLSIGLSAGLLVGTLTMLVISIPAEAFISVKISEMYWFFSALTMATIISKRHAG